MDPFSMMDSRDDVSSEVRLKSFNNAIMKILMVEERIEEKLDAVLAIKARRAPPRVHLQPVEHINTASKLSSEAFASNSNETPWRCTKSHLSIAPPEEASAHSLSPRSMTMDREGRHNTINLNSGGSVQMRTTFQLMIDEQTRESCTENAGTPFHVQQSSSVVRGTGSILRRRFFDYILINPNSLVLTGWSLITLMVLLAELTYLPYDFAFGVELHFTPLLTAVFWSFDLFVSFISGTYNAEGEVNPFRVSARAYLLSWFPLDITIILMDWISMLDWGGSLAYRFLLYIKVIRAWRIVAYLRASKLKQIMNGIVDMARPADGLRICLRVLYISLCMLLLLHLLACVWFLVGKIGPTDTGRRWLDVLVSRTDGTMIDVSSEVHGVQYMICLHWSIATFTLGNMEVGTANSYERMVVIFFTLFGYIFGSVLVSLLSAIIVDHQMQRMETTMRLRIVDRFLRENEVSTRMALRIHKVCAARLRMKQELTFSDTTALKELPASLYNDLRYEIIGCFLRRHDLFNCWSTLDASVAKEYSSEGVDIMFLKPGDDLFKAELDAQDAYFLSSGELTYSRINNDAYSNSVRVPPGSWLSEAALWSHWRHVGTCEAKTRCKIVVASSKSLAQHLRGHRLIRDITLSYCQLFCQAIAWARPPSSELPDDMCVPFTKFAEMLTHFPPDLRMILSTRAIKLSRLGHRTAAKLQSEVDSGKCYAYINTEGELERTVSVVVFMLQDSEGKVLYQIGEFIPASIVNETGQEEFRWKAVAELKLIGLKQDRGEFVGDTLQRLVEKKAHILKGRFKHTNTLCEEEVRFSKEFGVKTRYFRTKMMCSMQEQFPAKIVAHAPEDVTFTRKYSKSSTKSKSSGPSPSQCRQVSLSTMTNSPSSPSPIPLYVIFEGNKPYIYCWLPLDLAHMWEHTAQQRLDEMLNQLLSIVNVDIIDQGPYEVHRLEEEQLSRVEM